MIACMIRSASATSLRRAARDLVAHDLAQRPAGRRGEHQPYGARSCPIAGAAASDQQPALAVAQQRRGVGLDLVVPQQLGVRGHHVADEIVPGEEALLLLERAVRLGRRGADAALVVAQRGDARRRPAARRSASGGRCVRAASGLLPSRSVGPLPADQHDARHLLQLAEIGSSRVPASVAPSLPAKRTARCLVPVGIVALLRRLARPERRKRPASSARRRIILARRRDAIPCVASRAARRYGHGNGTRPGRRWGRRWRPMR